MPAFIPLAMVDRASMIDSPMPAAWCSSVDRAQSSGSIPAAIWWAVTTLTTTGYGDAVPVTPAGRVLGGIVMVAGIGAMVNK